MKVLIVEDEKLATIRLQTLLKQYDPDVEVVACLESIEETVAYLRQHKQPDLLLLDIHLSDGHCFEIFKQVNYTRPVIFTTAFDQYALDAFRICSIDYILKPVTLEALASALNKLGNLRDFLGSAELGSLADARLTTTNFKKRFLGKVGQRLFFIESEQVSYFQADNKIVYLVDKDGNRMIVDHTLERLEQVLDPSEFFRLNRKFIVRINAIQQVKPYYNNRLKLSVKGCPMNEEMVISRDKVVEFRKWAEG